MRFSTYVNVGPMYARLNMEPLEEVDSFKYQGSRVAADGGCDKDVVHRMTQRYKAWGRKWQRMGDMRRMWYTE